MTSRWPIRSPTEHAAIRAACRSGRPTPPVPALWAALVDAVDHRDREGVTIAAHLIVRATEPEVGEQ